MKTLETETSAYDYTDLDLDLDIELPGMTNNQGGKDAVTLFNKKPAETSQSPKQKTRNDKVYSQIHRNKQIADARGRISPKAKNYSQLMTRNRVAQMRSLSQMSKESRSSGERYPSQFERNIDIASDKHTPFGIPAHIKKEIKLFKRQQIDDEMNRSREEMHSYMHMESSTKNKSVKWTKQERSDQDESKMTGVTIEEGLYGPS